MEQSGPGQRPRWQPGNGNRENAQPTPPRGFEVVHPDDDRTTYVPPRCVEAPTVELRWLAPSAAAITPPARPRRRRWGWRACGRQLVVAAITTLLTYFIGTRFMMEAALLVSQASTTGSVPGGALMRTYHEVGVHTVLTGFGALLLVPAVAIFPNWRPRLRRLIALLICGLIVSYEASFWIVKLSQAVAA